MIEDLQKSYHESADKKLIFQAVMSNEVVGAVKIDMDVLLFLIHTVSQLECAPLPCFIKTFCQFINISMIFNKFGR